MNEIQAMIGGAQKSGTTSLFRYLGQHPSIMIHDRPEFAFFLNESYNNDSFDKFFYKFYGEIPTGKATILAKHVMLMYSKEAIARLYKHNPEALLIVMLRNPIDRAYSAYWYARRLGWEYLPTFEEALMAESERIKQDRFYWINCAYLSNSSYFEHLTQLIEIFGRNKLLIYFTEDLADNVTNICDEITQKMGIGAGFNWAVNQKYNPAAKARSWRLAYYYQRFSSSKSPLRHKIKVGMPRTWTHKFRMALKKINEEPFSPPPMNESTREELRQHFYQQTLMLSKLLDRSFTVWDS